MKQRRAARRPGEAVLIEDLVDTFAGADPDKLWDFAAKVLEATAQDFETFYPDIHDTSWAGPDVAAWMRAEAFHLRRRGDLNR